MNRYRKGMLQEAFVFMEAFYWNASRAAESAAALGLLKHEDRYRLFDAVKVRNKLIEHEDSWSRPSMTHGENPALKPGAVPPPQLTAEGVFEHAYQLASELGNRIDTAIASAP